MKKVIITISSFILLFFFYQSNVLSANKNKQAKNWEEYQLKNIYQSKNVFAKSIDEVLPEPQASLLNGMIFGIQGAISKDFFNALKKTGVLHIIALSGTNISILINAAFGFLTPLFGRKKAAISAILLIIIFIWFVGPSASVVRAGIMGVISLLAAYFGRQYLGVLSLVLACLIMIIVNPAVIKDIGFQLSVMATAGITLLVKSSKLKNKNYPSTSFTLREIEGLRAGNSKFKVLIGELIIGLKENLRITLSAQVFTLPILMANFGQISLVSPLTNVLIAPVVPLITNLGLLAGVIVVLIKPIGSILLWFLWIFLSYFVAVIKLTSIIPFASISFPKIGFWWGVGYYFIIFFFILRRKIKIKF